MAKTPNEILAELRKKDPRIAAAMQNDNGEKLEQLDRSLEETLGMCANGAAVLSVISWHEAKAPEEKEDARRSGIAAHALVSAVHTLLTSMPPEIRKPAIENFLVSMNIFMAQHEETLAKEIPNALVMRNAMLERLKAGRDTEAQAAEQPS